MRRIVTTFFMITLLTGMMVIPAAAGGKVYLPFINTNPNSNSSTQSSSTDTSGLIQDSTQLWFVEMPSSPTADGSSAAIAQKEKQNFRNEAKKLGLVYTERYAFNVLWNGLSIALDGGQVSKLNSMTTVKAIYPVDTIPMPQASEVSDPDLVTALAMTGADIVQNELGYSGDGIKVAIMDTGLDYDHSDLGGDGVQRSNSASFPTGRVIAGYDLVGDTYNADPTTVAYNPVTTPDAYPDDCAGHGSHVAGIVGANGTLKGVAPDVKFGAYRVFGCAGSTTADIMIAAMELALADGMDVLNMSIGSSFQWPQYPTAQASDRLVNQGMVVVASIGNSGANGLYAAGAPGVGKKVIGVASFDNTHTNLAAFSISSDDKLIGFTVATGAPPPPSSGNLPIAAASPINACTALAPGSMTGKAALIQRGGCTFYVKAYAAQQAGAAAVILFNNAAGYVNPTVAGVPPITIPVVSISLADGNLILTRLAGGPVTMTWTTQTISIPNATANLISSFSSYGLPPDLSQKPDLGAPGGFIRSTYPLELGGYTNLSGTSMASPHVAGAVALYLQAHPNTNSQVMRDILQNSADPKLWAGNPSLGFLDNVHRQGAGMLDIDDTILATTKIEPGKLALGESEFGPVSRTLSIENKSSLDVTYDLSHIGALATGPNTFTPAFFASFASVSFSAPSVTVPAGGSTSVDVTVTAPAALADKSLYGGYIIFTPQGGGQIFRVAYSGFKGDYQTIQALAPTANNFPWLSRMTACTLLRGLECMAGGVYAKAPPGSQVFSLVNAANTPYVLVHLDHQVRRLRMEVFDANTGKAWHRAYDLEYLGRNSLATSFFAYPWDGTTRNGNKINTVPDGQYWIKLSVLKALGDDNNPAHWEYWTSPVITIDRP